METEIKSEPESFYQMAIEDLRRELLYRVEKETRAASIELAYEYAAKQMLLVIEKFVLGQLGQTAVSVEDVKHVEWVRADPKLRNILVKGLAKVMLPQVLKSRAADDVRVERLMEAMEKVI